LEILVGTYDFLDLVLKGSDEDGAAFSMSCVGRRRRYSKGRLPGGCSRSRSAILLRGAPANLVRLPTEDQKIIHAVGFHEILRVAQFVAGFGGFANNHIFIHSMIRSVAIAIDDSNPGSRSKG
jgi:hypothetical protein